MSETAGLLSWLHLEHTGMQVAPVWKEACAHLFLMNLNELCRLRFWIF